MLVLTRKPGEKILVGSNITITILEVNGPKMRIGIDAPDDIAILRAELCEFQSDPSASPAERERSK